MTTPEYFYTTKAYQTTDRVDQTTFAEGRKRLIVRRFDTNAQKSKWNRLIVSEKNALNVGW